MTRPAGSADVLDALADQAARILDRHPRPTLAVDGPDAAGKTTLADRLAERLEAPVLRASIDGFHNPPEVRRARGPLSPVGYYRDSFDLAALIDRLLVPFVDGSPTVTTRVFDARSEMARSKEAAVPERCLLIVDGVFLLRPELRRYWCFSVYLHVPPEVSLRRALIRDSDLMGGPTAVSQRYHARYLPGQALYRQEATPKAHADVVLDHSDPTAPVVMRSELAL